ncbi:MAG: YbaB/EbfC family nucleoid-associated protein [Butyricicoccaceae bacterium]
MARRGFPGMSPKGGMGGMNMNAMIKKAQKMQEDMAKAQAELAEKEYTATAGGGAVSVTVKGSNEIVDLKLNPEVVDPDDIEMLQDLIVAAVNQALKTADEESAKIMRNATGGAGIPGVF